RRCPAAKCLHRSGVDNLGGPERSRTSDLRFRKPLLYPAELRDRVDFSALRIFAFRFVSFLSRHSAGIAMRSDGGTNITTTRREPQRGHFRRLSSLPIGKSRPRVHTSVGRSSSAP